MNFQNKKSKGFSLIELVLAIAFFAIIAGGTILPIINSHLNQLEVSKRIQANAVLNETWEALRAIRNRDWANIANGTYGLDQTSGIWEFSGASDVVNGITRSITISNAERNLMQNLVESGGMNDPNSKRVSIQLSWDSTPYSSHSIEVDSLITNYMWANP